MKEVIRHTGLKTRLGLARFLPRQKIIEWGEKFKPISTSDWIALDFFSLPKEREWEREAVAHSNNNPSPQIKAHNEQEHGNNWQFSVICGTSLFGLVTKSINNLIGVTVSMCSSPLTPRWGRSARLLLIEPCGIGTAPSLVSTAHQIPDGRAHSWGARLRAAISSERENTENLNHRGFVCFTRVVCKS